MLVTIAEKRGDKPAIVQFATESFLGSHNFAEYDRIRENIPADEWPERVDQIIHQLQEAAGRWPGRNDGVIADIYVREKRWDDLRKVVIKHGIGILEQYRK